MERTRLLSELVQLDGQIVALTSQAARTTDDRELKRVIAEVRKLRVQRGVLKAKLDALEH